MKPRRRVRVRVIIFMLLLAVPVIAQKRSTSRAQETPASVGWYTFTGPDRDFTLLFPQKPQREPDGQGIVTIIRMYGVTTAEGLRFSVNFQDIGGDPRAPHNNEWVYYLERVTAEAAHRRGEEVVQVHRLAKNVVEMELWQTVPEAGAKINYLRRTVLRRGRIYDLGCGSVINNLPVNKATCRRFFRSFRPVK